MANQRIIVEPSSSDPYKSVLCCTVCSFRTDDLLMMQSHCSVISHKSKLYREDLVCVNRPAEPLASDDKAQPLIAVSEQLAPLVANRETLDAILNSNDGMPYEEVVSTIRMCQKVNFFQCELCRINVTDIETFLLHLTGFGHSQRCQRLKTFGSTYYQPFWDSVKSSLFYLCFNDSSIHDRIQPLTGKLYGYSVVSEISIIPRVVLEQFMSVVM